VDGDVVDLLQVALETLAVAAVGIFEDRQLALAIAAHDREGVLHGQQVETDGRELVHTLLSEVAALPGVKKGALDQEVALGIGVEDLHAVDAHLEQAGHRRSGDLVDVLELGNALAKVLANGRLLGARREAEQHQE
jgi:hypothetical protein